MATSFPTGLDAIQRVVATDLRNAPGKEGHVLHNNVCDAIEALQAKVGVDGSTVITSIDKRLTDAEADIVAAQSAADAAALAAAQTIKKTIDTRTSGNELFSFLINGDSTGCTNTRWPYLLALSLSATYPNSQILYRDWDAGNSRWNAATIVQAGNGTAGQIVINNGCVSGSLPNWMIGAEWGAFVSVGGDCIILNHGHNITAGTWGTTNAIISTYAEVVEPMLLAVGPAAVLIVAQNPAQTDANAPRAVAARQYANALQCACADVYAAFMAAGNGAGLYADSVHPSDATGSPLFRDTILTAINTQSAPRVFPALIGSGGQSLITNGDFSLGSANAVPTGFSSSNLTVADLTALGSNCETPPRALSLIATTGSGQAFMYYALSTAQLQACAGQIVTLAARVFVPTGAPDTVGRIGLIVSGTGAVSQTSEASAKGRGAWKWLFCSVLVPVSPTYVRCYVYADSSSTPTVDSNYAARVDRMILVIGRRPRDLGSR